MPKRYTEAELMEFENCPRYQGSSVVRELTDYIRKVVGTVEIPQFHPLPTAVERSILRHRRKLALERIDRATLRKLRVTPKWRWKPFTEKANAAKG